MNFEDLLKDTDSSFSWKTQRAKFIRILLGISILTISLVVGSLLFFSIPGKKLEGESKQSSDKNVEHLSRLMQMRNETSSLQQEMKKAIGSASVHSKDKKKRSHLQRDPSSLHESIQVVNFVPEGGFTQLVTEEDESYIPTGAVFQARLVTPIKTSVAATFVIAETTNEYRLDFKRRILKGSRLIGRARLNPVLRGVIVEFDKLVLPNGMETNMNGLALSRNALPEIDGLYFSDSLQNYGAALAFGFLGGYTRASQQNFPTIYGFVPEPNLKNQALGGLSMASFQLSEEILRDIRARSIEYVLVPAGEPVFVALTQKYNVNQEKVE